MSGSLYEDSDGNKYHKQTVFQSVDIISGLLGEEFTAVFGSYTFTNGENLLTVAQSENKDRFFAYEPIVWQVLSVDENGIALVVSDKVLANMPFQPTIKVGDDDRWYTSANDANDSSTYANVYKYSNIRYWLNGMSQSGQTGSMTNSAGDELNSDIINGMHNYKELGLSTNLGYPTFLQTAFSQIEQDKIKATSGIGANDATTYRTEGTGDKVFILSHEDVFNNATYFADRSARIKKTTELAKATYTVDTEFMDPTSGGSYMLRSTYSSDCVDICSIMGEYTFVNGFLNGVMPAMYLDTSDMTELKAYSDSACTAEVSTGKLTTDNGTNHNYIQFGSWPQTVADVIESAESGGSGSSGSGAGSGSEVSSTGIDINLIGLYFGMGAVAVSAMAISKVLNKNKKKLSK